MQTTGQNVSGLVIVLALGVATAPLRAETPLARSQGFVYVAPMFYRDGGILTRPLIGGGGDVAVWKRVTLSGDVGWVASAQEGFGLASVNAAYHLPGSFRDGKLVPFVSGGYSVGFRSSALSLGNVGGGFNYWFRERTAFRFEGRLYTRPSYSVFALRLGVSFR